MKNTLNNDDAMVFVIFSWPIGKLMTNEINSVSFSWSISYSWRSVILDNSNYSSYPSDVTST